MPKIRSDFIGDAEIMAKHLDSTGSPNNGQYLCWSSEYSKFVWKNNGDVAGPESSADGNVVIFDGTTGKVVKDSGLKLSGTNTGDQDLSGYVTKVTGKGLSTNDLTNELKSSYDNASSKAHIQNTDIQLKSPDGTKIPLYTDNGGAVHIDGDIIQNGSTYETHAEQVYTKDDKIILRDGATAGLGNGEYAGFVAKKYDGANDGHLVFDKDGIARVGDVGGEQPLATREENPLDSGLAKWNATTLRFETVANSADNINESSTRLYVSPTEKNTWNGKAEQTQLPYFQVKTTIDATLLLGTIYRLGTLSGDLSFALPDPTTAVLQEIALIFNLDSNLRTLTITGTNFYPSTLTLVINLGYVIRLVSDGTKWVVGKRSFVKT